MIDTASPRLFLVLTLAEAEAILRPTPSAARARGLAKIRTALAGASPLSVSAIPVAPPDRPLVADRDDYVPWRDEAGGIHR